MKHWLYERFLPMWAKETLLKDYRQLQQAHDRLHRKLQQREAYIKGLEKAFSLGRRGTALARWMWGVQDKDPTSVKNQRFLTASFAEVRLPPASDHSDSLRGAPPQGEAIGSWKSTSGGKK